MDAHTHYFIFMLFYIMHEENLPTVRRKKPSQGALLHLTSHIRKILVGSWNAFSSQTLALFPSDRVGCFNVK